MPEKKTHKTVKGLKMIPINLDYNLKKAPPYGYIWQLNPRADLSTDSFYIYCKYL